jgi:exopolyphosphatase/pppGpp-phosphohydrolase
MADDETVRRLSEAAWDHINADHFEEAEVAFRKVLAEIDHDDHGRRWFELVGSAGALNMLDRADEGTEAYRQALVEAQRLPPGSTEVNTARYMLGIST